MDFASSSLAESALDGEFNIFNFLNFSDFNGLKAVESASSLLLGASGHVEGGDKTLSVVDGAVLLADTHFLRLGNAQVLRWGITVISWEFLKALKSTGSLDLGASLEVKSGDNACAIIDSASLFASATLSVILFRFFLDFNLERLGLDTLKAVKSARSLLLGARVNVEGGDEALAIIDAAVLLADAHILGSLNVLQAGEAANSAGGLSLEASLVVTSGDKAFTEVETAVLLADAHFPSHN